MKRADLIERLKLLNRVMTSGHGQNKMIRVWKDDIDAVEAAIKLIEGIKGEEE